MDQFNDNTLIHLKDEHWLARQRIAGQCVAQCLSESETIIKANNGASLKDLEQHCLTIMTKYDCSPTFLNYKGFPGAICTSVNKQLVHGIPSDYKIKSGDVVKVDLGATYQGAIADSAITAIAGKPTSFWHPELIITCQKALTHAIQAIKIGARLGAIGQAIHHVVKGSPFRAIINYGGHGIDENRPHAPPFVANKAKDTEGVRFQPGMTLAIEPMVVISPAETKVLADGWTVVTPEIGVHFEETIFIHPDRVEVITWKEGGYLKDKEFFFPMSGKD